jgi:hypothetical protein
MVQERAPVGEVRHRSEEGETARIAQGIQPGE